MFLLGIGGGRTWPCWTVQNLATDQGPRQAHTLSLSHTLSCGEIDTGAFL